MIFCFSYLFQGSSKTDPVNNQYNIKFNKTFVEDNTDHIFDQIDHMTSMQKQKMTIGFETDSADDYDPPTIFEHAFTGERLVKETVDSSDSSSSDDDDVVESYHDFKNMGRGTCQLFSKF